MNTHTQTAVATIGRPKDAAKRADILKAATALFLKEGYELTSIEAVAKKADVSKLTIYSHFADKNELFASVIRMRCDKLASPESFKILMGKPPRAALTELATTFMTHIFTPDSIGLHRVMQAEAIRHPNMAKIFYETGPKRVRVAFGELLQHYVDQGDLVIPDIPKSTGQFFSLIKGELLMKTMLGLERYPAPTEIKQHVKASVDMFLAAYAVADKIKGGR